MEAEGLKYCILFAFGFLLVIWVSIIYSLLHQKFRKKKLHEIESTFATILSDYLYGPKDEYDFIRVQRVFRKIGITENKPQNVQYLIDLMIRTLPYKG